jgi:signal transduction histidine kinase
LFIYVLFYVAAFLLGIAISHKIYGPFVNIERMLNRYLAGDYSDRIKLRKDDDAKVHEVAVAINKLADKLAKS